MRRSRPAGPFAAVLFASALTMLLIAPPAGAQVTQVGGSAVGYKTEIGLFGGPKTVRGDEPKVTLPAGGSPQPVTADRPSGLAQYGPATIFSSGPLRVSTQGTLGPGGSVTSSAEVQNQNTSGDEVFTASRVQSSCKAEESGASGSTTIQGGILRVSEGNPDVDGDDTNVTIPTNPAPNTEHTGTIEAVGDNFRIIFNEQIPQAGGVTINAVHMILLGPSAVGDLWVGQVFCSVNGGGGGTGGGGTGGGDTGGRGGGSSSTTTTRGSSDGGSSGGGSSGSGSGGSGTNMPKTGFDTLPLAVVGTEMVAGGIAAVLWAGRRRRWPRR